MQLNQIIEALNLEILNEGEGLDQEVKEGYVGDLLSDVIASGKPNSVWITIQVHENIIAVASLKDLAAVILAKNSQPLDETLESAGEEGVTLLRSSLNSYDLVAKLHSMGVPGSL